MLLQRQHHLRAEAHERTNVSYGYANGFKNRTLANRLCTIELSIPPVRVSDASFRPAPLDGAMASKKGPCIALAEMTIQGVAHRRVKGIIESLCGFQISAMLAR